MPKESKSSLKPKKGESFLDAASQIAAKIKMEEVHEGIETFLRVAYLKRKGILKEDFWPFELDTPTTIINVLADYLVLYYEILNDIDLPKTGTGNKKNSVFDILTGINKNFQGIKSDSNFFIRVGKNWIIGYKGKSTTLQDYERIRYIVNLLDRPFISTNVVDLFGYVKKKEPELSDVMGSAINEWKSLGKEKMREGGVDIVYLEIDKLTKKQKDRLSDIGHESLQKLNDARKRKNEEEINQAKEELERFRKYMLNEYAIKTYVTARGIKFEKMYRSGPENERAIKNVTNQIKKAIKDIEKEIPSLAQHLFRYIETGTNCIYRPDDSIDWHISW